MMRLKFLVVALAAAVLVLAPGAQADPITFNFSGTVSSDRGNILGGAGATFTGSFTFDPLLTSDTNTSTNKGTYLFADPSLTFTVTDGSSVFVFQLSRIDVWDNVDQGGGNFQDVYQVSGLGSSPGDFFILNLRAFGSLPLSLITTGDALPLTPPDLALATTLNRISIITSGGRAEGSLNSLTVPELFVLSQVFTTGQPGFGAPVALDGNTALVGAPGGIGSASLLNNLNGEVLQTFDNPNPSTSGTGPTDSYAAAFFTTVDLSSGRVLISAEIEDVAAAESGAVYLFDAGSGDLLRTFTHPNPIPDLGGSGQHFGREIALNGDYALVSSLANEAFLFDVVSGNLLCTFPGPSPGLFGFGSSRVALSEQFVAIGEITNGTGGTNAGAVQLFDKATGSNLQTFFNPTPSDFDSFGEAIAIDGNRVLIGTGQVDVNSLSNTGEAYLFDAITGVLLHTFVDPTPNSNASFGSHLDIEGDLVAIGAFVDNEVHVFNAVSGNLLQTLTEPSVLFSFGASVDLDRGNLLVGTVFGQAFLYTIGQNQAPTANAGIDQPVRVGDTVFLDGSASFDDNTPTASLAYAWSFSSLPVGSNAVLLGADTSMPTFVVDVAGTYLVQLVVTDQVGLESFPDDVTISSDNLAPTADAGLDQLVVVGSTVFLDGSGSTDPENDFLTYSWMISSAPQGSTAALFGAGAASPSFVPDLEGLYQVTLVVSDPIGPGTPDAVEITAITPGQFAEFEILAASDTVTTLGTEEVTTRGNQTALLNFLTQAIVAIQEGDLAKAINKLQKALSRTDGCELRGAPDGNGPGRDWITDCDAQSQVYGSLQSALTALSP